MKASLATSFLRPWNDEWQLWTSQGKEKAVELRERGPLSEINTTSATLCAARAGSVVAIPFLVDSTDTAIARSMAAMELEMRGFIVADRPSTNCDIKVLAEKEGKTLILGIVYPADPDPGSIPEKAGYFLPSPLGFVTKGSEFQIWREFDDIVVSIVWRDSVVCWETMDAATDKRVIASWMFCLFAQIRHDLAIDDDFALRQWIPIFDAPPKWLSSEVGCSDLERLDGPPPLTPFPNAGWIPPTLQTSLQRERRRRVLLKAAAIAAGVLLGIAITAVGYVYQIKQKSAAIDAEIALIDERFHPIKQVAEHWNRLEPTIDPRLFPLEVLHQTVDALPKAGVRLTVFESSPEGVLIEGEAMNVSGAADYYKMLASNAALSESFNFEMAPPSLQANNTARFVIIGLRQ